MERVLVVPRDQVDRQASSVVLVMERDRKRHRLHSDGNRLVFPVERSGTIVFVSHVDVVCALLWS